MASDLFTADFKPTPYWWERTPLAPEEGATLPDSCDVAVVGGGYTGLHAALQIARGGRHVVVLDAEPPGWGCSTRNGGQVSSSVKPDYETLAKRHGAEAAQGILQEGVASLAWTGNFIREEGLDCDFRVCGRFHAAHSAKAFTQMVEAYRGKPSWLDRPARVVTRGEQREELGTDAYCGGLLFERHASLDPGRYHAGLLGLVRQAGALAMGRTPVTGLQREGGGFQLQTVRGGLKAQKVVLATNGYSGPLSPWHRRRVIPIGSYVIATEPLAPDLMARLMPNRRIVSDSRKVVYYYRPSPDGRRIVFGGRVSAGETDPTVSAPLLHRSLTRIFPELEKTRISHSWMGFVAYTFGGLAHLGDRDGLYHAMGYCGSGVGMAGYLGMRTGLRVLGKAAGASPMAGPAFQTRPLYRGRPWFLPASVAYYRLKDRWSLR